MWVGVIQKEKSNHIFLLSHFDPFSSFLFLHIKRQTTHNTK
jgi:hypothetical protein